MKTRRAVLRRTSAVLGLATLGGCSALSSGSSGGGLPWYARWMPPFPLDVLRFGAHRPSTVAAIDAIPERLVQPTVLGIPATDVDRYASIHGTTVLEGDFDAWTISARIEEEYDVSLTLDGEYRGFERYTGSIGREVLGVSDGTAVYASEGSFEGTIDARRNETDRFVAGYEDAERFLGAFGAGDWSLGFLRGSPDAQSMTLPNEIGSGTRMTLGEERTTGERVRLFETEQAVDEDAVVGDLETREAVSSVSVSTDGRLVRVEYELPTREL